MITIGIIHCSFFLAGGGGGGGGGGVQVAAAATAVVADAVAMCQWWMGVHETSKAFEPKASVEIYCFVSVVYLSLLLQSGGYAFTRYFIQCTALMGTLGPS